VRDLRDVVHRREGKKAGRRKGREVREGKGRREKEEVLWGGLG
jgi:hypothetical protein